jgi:hypothetical protein
VWARLVTGSEARRTNLRRGSDPVENPPTDPATGSEARRICQ